MRKTIQLVRPSIAIDGVLIRGSLLQNNARADDLIRQARRRARRIVEDAQEQAADAMRRASARGYADGLVAVAEVLAQYLAAHVELAERIRSATIERTAALLRNCLSRPDVIEAAMLDALPTRDDAQRGAELLLPQKLGDMDVLAEELNHADEEAEELTLALERSLVEEWEEFRLVARDPVVWEDVWNALLSLDRDHHDRLRALLEQCCEMSTEYISGQGGLFQVLTADQKTALKEMQSAPRERQGRRGGQGRQGR